jgi:acetamidase/formamidase
MGVAPDEPAQRRRARLTCAMGIADELMEYTRRAISGMIDWLVSEHALSRQDAYVLCSLAGDANSR